MDTGKVALDRRRALHLYVVLLFSRTVWNLMDRVVGALHSLRWTGIFTTLEQTGSVERLICVIVSFRASFLRPPLNLNRLVSSRRPLSLFESS